MLLFKIADIFFKVGIILDIRLKLSQIIICKDLSLVAICGGGGEKGVLINRFVIVMLFHPLISYSLLPYMEDGINDPPCN